MALAQRPCVAVGGRWRRLEDENIALAAELRACRDEVAVATEKSVLQECENRSVRAENGLLEGEFFTETVAAKDRRQELCVVELAFAETAKAAVHSAELAHEYELSSAMLESHSGSIREQMEKMQTELLKVRHRAIDDHNQFVQEETKCSSAELCCESLRSELDSAELHLRNRGMHVDLLLRDKQRLWEQLAQIRRQSSNTITQDQGRGSAKGKTTSSTPTKSAGPGSHRRDPSAPSFRRPGATKVCLPNQSQASNVKPTCMTENSIDLERQNWHMRRALAREREAHEQTRQALLTYQGSLSVQLPAGCAQTAV